MAGVEDDGWLGRDEFDCQQGWRMTAGWGGMNLTASRKMTTVWGGVGRVEVSHLARVEVGRRVERGDFESKQG